MSKGDELALLIVGAVGGLMVGFLIGWPIHLYTFGSSLEGSRAVRDEAAEAGAGEWRADPKTGATSFVWLKRD